MFGVPIVVPCNENHLNKRVLDSVDVVIMQQFGTIIEGRSATFNYKAVTPLWRVITQMSPLTRGLDMLSTFHYPANPTKNVKHFHLETFL